MPRDLFGDVTRPSISIGSRKWYTVPVSLLSHSTRDGRGAADSGAVDVARGLDGDASPTSPRSFRRRHPRRRFALAAATGQSECRANRGPHRSEKSDEELPPSRTTIPVGSSAGTHQRTSPAARRTSSGSPPVEPVRVGGTVRPPMKVRDARPVYPAMAIAARSRASSSSKPRSASTGGCATRGFCARYRSSIRPRSTRCANGNTRRRC